MAENQHFARQGQIDSATEIYLGTDSANRLFLLLDPRYPRSSVENQVSPESGLGQTNVPLGHALDHSERDLTARRAPGALRARQGRGQAQEEAARRQSSAG